MNHDHPSRVIRLWTIVSICFFGGLVDGRNWNSHQVAVGEWKVSLQGGWFFDPSRIFPPTSTSSTSRNSRSSSLKPKRRPWGSNLDCTLSINQDGTFLLTPATNINKQSASNNNGLPLRGQWTIESNPYCVTDRFYDQLYLESYPRLEIDSKTNLPLRQVQLHLSGRMWGRYSKPKGKMNGRITHGALVCKEEQTMASKKKKLKSFLPKLKIGRPIWGSFSALRASRYPTADGWDDQQYFSY